MTLDKFDFACKIAQHSTSLIIIQKPISFIFALILVLSFSAGAFAGESITYQEGSWDDTNKKVIFTTKTLSDSQYTVLDSSATWDSNGGEVYYYANQDLTLGTVTLKGTVHLILANGITLNTRIILTEGNTIHIYGSGTLNAGISGGWTNRNTGVMNNGGNVTIHGGTVNANGESDTAGIGGGFNGSAGDITIYGGIVTANGNNTGAGIGGGFGGKGGNVKIYGGTVTANGSALAGGIGAGDSTASDGSITLYSSNVKTAGGPIGYGGAVGHGLNASYTLGDNLMVLGGTDSNPMEIIEDQNTRYRFMNVIDKNDVKYVITFNNNLTDTPKTRKQAVLKDVTQLNLLSNNFTRTGYTFTKWTTNADGTGTSYEDAASINPTANMTLYAQ